MHVIKLGIAQRVKVYRVLQRMMHERLTRAIVQWEDAMNEERKAEALALKQEEEMAEKEKRKERLIAKIVRQFADFQLNVFVSWRRCILQEKADRVAAEAKRERIIARMVAAMGELNLKVFRAWRGVLEAKKKREEEERVKLQRFAAKLFYGKQHKIFMRWHMFVEAQQKEKFW